MFTNLTERFAVSPVLRAYLSAESLKPDTPSRTVTSIVPLISPYLTVIVPLPVVLGVKTLSVHLPSIVDEKDNFDLSTFIACNLPS